MKRLGKSTVALNSTPHIINTASIVGKKEGEGPLKNYFDYILEDEYWGEKSFEKTESKLAVYVLLSLSTPLAVGNLVVILSEISKLWIP